MFVNLYIYMIVMMSFFTLKFDKNGPLRQSYTIWLGPLIIVCWTVFFIATKDRLEVNDQQALIDVQALKLLEETDDSKDIDKSQTKSQRMRSRYRRFNEHQMKNSYIHPFKKKFKQQLDDL